MRTTITLEPDVEVRLKRLMQERSLSFKDAVNETLRAGLDHAREAERVDPYVVPTFAMGVRPGIDYHQIRHWDEEQEDDERLRKMGEGR